MALFCDKHRLVMRGLTRASRSGWHCAFLSGMAGTSPAMTTERLIFRSPPANNEIAGRGPAIASLASTERNAYAAFFFAVISLRFKSTSAICTALSAAPLRRLSDTHHSTMPFSTVGSSRTRLI